MARTLLVITFTTILIITAGVVAADDTSQQDTFAQVVVDDLVIGEDEQRLGPIRAVGIDEDVEEVVVEIDVSVLENHGVDIGHAEANLTNDDVRGATVVSTAVEDEVITLVFAPENSVIEVEPFKLTGLGTGGAEAASDLTFDVMFSEGDGEGYSFDIINPDQVNPTVVTDTLYTGFGEHYVTVEGIQPTDRNVTIELDTSVLKDHGVTVDDLEADVDPEGATVRETNVENGVVNVILAPADNTVLFDARIHLSEFGTTSVDTDEQVVASNVTYEVHIDGDASDSVDVESFEISGPPQQEERTQQNKETATIGDEGPGFGIVIALIVFGGSSLLVARYK